MSNDVTTPETHPGANAQANYQMAFDAMGQPGSTLLYDDVQSILHKNLATLVAEMKKKHYHLVKRRSLVEQFHQCLVAKTVPSNLAMKLAPHNFPTTIDERIVKGYNHKEQLAWMDFKFNIFSQRAEIIVADLATLEESFALYLDTEYLKERFIRLAPAIRPHANVISGLVLSFSVIYAEVNINPSPTTKKRRSSISSNVSNATSCANSDDGMNIDESSSSIPPNSTTTSSSSSSSATASSSSSFSSASSSSSTALPRVSLQQQINDLTKLVQASITKNTQGDLPQRGRPARSASPATPHRASRLPTTPVSQDRSPITQESSFIRSPGQSTSPFQGKSAMKLIPTRFPTTFSPFPPTQSTPGMDTIAPAFYLNQYGAYSPHNHITPQPVYGHQPAYPQQYGYPPTPTYTPTQYYSGALSPPQPPLPPTPPPVNVRNPPEGTPDYARKKAPGSRGKQPKGSIRFAPWNPPRIHY